MRIRTLIASSTSRTILVLSAAAVLAASACDNDVNFNPARPTFDFPTGTTFSDLTPGTGRNLAITGTLTAEQGSCYEATVLYDGDELAGARTVCPDASGCTRLELSAFVQSSIGQHTISFQVLRQSPGVVGYLADGTVRVTRDGISLGGAILPLRPTRARLRRGESVSFDVSFQ